MIVQWRPTVGLPIVCQGKIEIVTIITDANICLNEVMIFLLALIIQYQESYAFSVYRERIRVI